MICGFPKFVCFANAIINFCFWISFVCDTYLVQYIIGWTRLTPYLDTFLKTLTFILHNFLWSDIVPGIKPVKLSNVDMLVKLGIWRNGSQGIAKKTFFWNPSLIILLEIRDNFLSLLQPWRDCARLILHNNDIHKNLNCTFYRNGYIKAQFPEIGLYLQLAVNTIWLQ